MRSLYQWLPSSRCILIRICVTCTKQRSQAPKDDRKEISVRLQSQVLFEYLIECTQRHWILVLKDKLLLQSVLQLSVHMLNWLTTSAPSQSATSAPESQRSKRLDSTDDDSATAVLASCLVVTLIFTDTDKR